MWYDGIIGIVNIIIAKADEECYFFWAAWNVKLNNNIEIDKIRQNNVIDHRFQYCRMHDQLIIGWLNILL